jgi:hypothetical protein
MAQIYVKDALVRVEEYFRQDEHSMTRLKSETEGLTDAMAYRDDLVFEVMDALKLPWSKGSSEYIQVQRKVGELIEAEFKK